MRNELHNMQSAVNGDFAYHAMATNCVACKLPHMRVKLRDFREMQGITLEVMAERSGYSVSQLSRWEAGVSNIPSERLPILARAYGCLVSDIFEEDGISYMPIGPRLFVKGEVAAGVWKEAYEWPQDDWRTFTGRPDGTAPLDHRFGLLISGDSMDEVYPTGTIVECVSFLGGAEIASGRRVVVLRQRDDLEYEATVKEYVVDDLGRQWLVPRSRNPQFTPISLDQPEEGIIETRIIAVVVSSYRPE